MFIAVFIRYEFCTNLSQLNLLHNLTYHFFNVNFDIIFLFTGNPPKPVHPFNSHNWNVVSIVNLSLPFYCPASLILLDLNTVRKSAKTSDLHFQTEWDLGQSSINVAKCNYLSLWRKSLSPAPQHNDDPRTFLVQTQKVRKRTGVSSWFLVRALQKS